MIHRLKVIIHLLPLQMMTDGSVLTANLDVASKRKEISFRQKGGTRV